MSAQPRLVAIGDLVADLAAHAEALAAELLPGGTRRVHEWCVPRAASPFGCSVSVHLRGAKAGVWAAWAAGIGGDALDLVAAVKFGGDKREAIAWARGWLGNDQGTPRRAPADRPTPTVLQLAEPDAKAKRDAAFRLWLAARPLSEGDEAFDYLAETRGIDFRALGRIPRALRYISGLTNLEADRRFPALLAVVVDGQGRFLTVHRTWLERQSDGRVLKAPVAEPKKVYGPCKGGTIRLARGASGKPWKEAPPGDVLGLTEGVENALSYAVAVAEHRVAAALNVGNLASVILPSAIGTVIIAADNDAPGSSAEQALQRAVARFLAEGRQVRIARCPPGIKDLNALLLGGC
jgi:phage/plasmid primase-like uncharacterized protein